MLASFLERFEERLRELEKRIGYGFKRRELLLEALLHRSFAKEAGIPVDNERLEFLGDAFLNFEVGLHLFKSRPGLSEGGLTKERAALVREEALAWAARRIGLGDFLLLGKGEEAQGGRYRDSNLADAFEALVGAVLLDGGILKARSLVRRLLVKSNVPRFEDYKSRLVELCDRLSYPQPTFRVENQGSVVRVELRLNGFRAVVFGSSRREAERFASRIAYARFAGVSSAP